MTITIINHDIYIQCTIKSSVFSESMFFFMSWLLEEGFVTDDFFAMEKAPFPIEFPRWGPLLEIPVPAMTGQTPYMSLQLGCHTNHP